MYSLAFAGLPGNFRSAALSALAIAALVCAAPLVSAADDYRMVKTLDIPEQIKTEALAAKLWAAPEMKRERDIVYQHWVKDPAAATPLGKKQLREAIDDMSASTCMMVANERDPAHPHFTWVWESGHTWAGTKYPDQSTGIENPDNLYRHVAIDGFSKYEVTVRPKQPGVLGFNFQVYDVFIESSPRSNALIDSPITALSGSDLKNPEPDGSYKITIDSEPANGRPNHIQITADTRAMWTRSSVGDWDNEIPPEIEIKRISSIQPNGEAPKAPSERDLLLRAVNMFGVGANRVFYMKNEAGYNFLGTPNRKPKLLNRGFKRWGYFAFANWKFAKDEALLVTLDPLDFKYTGFVVTTPWMVTREYVHANGSLNIGQARPNHDGTYTYIVSATDPGVHNWLDTGGLYEGGYMLRWQYPRGAEVPDGDNGIREVKVVKLADLHKLLPPETVWVTPEQRKKMYVERAKAYSHRGGDAADKVYEAFRKTKGE